MEKTFIEGTTIDLTPLSLDYVNDTYVNWFNDAEVCKYNSHHAYPYTRELAVEYVTRVRSQKSDLVLAIIAKDSGKHVGNISLQKIDPIGRSAEFAIVVGDRDYWGKGVAKEASRLVIAHGFETLNLHRIYCGTSAANTPMQKLAASLGFVEEGIRKEALYKDGSFVDIIEYGMLRGASA